MPSQLQHVQKPTRRAYWILPRDINGQATFVYALSADEDALDCDLKACELTIRAGKMLKNATSPFGVVAGTRSSAADRMITYSTKRQLDPLESDIDS